MIRPLRAAGHILHLPAALGVSGQDDEAHLRTAAGLGAVLVTINQRDFVRLHRDWHQRQEVHAGILLSQELDPGELVRRLHRAARLLSPEAARGQLLHLGGFNTDEDANNYVTSLTPPA